MTKITSVRKRNGAVADFAPDKIKKAVRAAFLEVKGMTDEVLIGSLADHVVAHMDATYGEGGVPSVEDIQNIVEHVLMERGLFDVAKAYIIYRYEHTKEREVQKQEVLKKMEEGGLWVVKHSGEREHFSLEKLENTILRYASGIEQLIDAKAIAEQCRMEIYDNISTKDIARAVVLVARSMIEKDPAYTKLTVRLLLSTLYKDVIGADNIDFQNLDQQYRVAFIASITKGVQVGKLDPRMLGFDLNALSKQLQLDRDDIFDYLGLQTLMDRYFLQNPYTKQVLETPQMFWMRVAMGLSLLEKTNREARAVEFYDIMSTLHYVPSTPTLFHAGTTLPQLSSCYLTTVDDSLDHIFKCFGDNAQLSKWSGGIGNDWSNLRATGAIIKGTGVDSQGVVPFLKIANDTTVAINRSGKRRGATCAYLECWHMDFEDFLELRKNTGDERRRTHDMNTAAWIPDLFMQRVREDKDWTFFSPEETPELHHVYGSEFKRRYEMYEQKTRDGGIRLFKTIKARDLWRKMISMLFETGHPWITWKDPCNVRSPQDHTGVIHSSNLCTEITLNTSFEETAVCNLGSINLAKHIKDNEIDLAALERTTNIAMRMLDNVIDLCFYPTDEAKRSNMRHRPVGLGIMGFQDALFEINMPFSSEATVRFADRSMEAVAYYTISASCALAKERGAYQSFRGSKWDKGIFPLDTIALLEQERGEKIDVDRSKTFDWDALKAQVKEYGMRNSNCMAIAPTATISNISSCFPSIEPIYKNIYVKSNMSGEFTVVNEYLVHDLKKLNMWDAQMLNDIKRNDGSISAITRIPQDIREKYREVFDIQPTHLVKVAAYRMKWLDQSQSYNMFYRGTSGKDISDIYQYAWSMGLKTTYYLRTLAASQVEKSTVTLTASSAGQGSQNVFSEVKKKATSSASAAHAGISEERIKEPPAATTAQVLDTTPSVVVGPDGKLVKLCKLNDPDCEACQ